MAWIQSNPIQSNPIKSNRSFRSWSLFQTLRSPAARSYTKMRPQPNIPSSASSPFLRPFRRPFSFPRLRLHLSSSHNNQHDHEKPRSRSRKLFDLDLFTSTRNDNNTHHHHHPEDEECQISLPFDLKHTLHIRYNYVLARFEGLPDEQPPPPPGSTKTLAGFHIPSCKTDLTKSTLTFAPLRECTKPKSKTKKSKTKSKSKGKSEHQPNITTFVNQQFRVSYKHVPRLPLVAYHERIPAVLVMLRDALFENHGHLTTHIFRISPPKDVRDLAMDQINSGTFAKNEQATQDCLGLEADLIKVWFRELPVPLLHQLTPGTMDQLVQVLRKSESSNPQPNLRIDTLLAQAKMGSVERSILYWLVDLLLEISTFERRNFMGLKQLAIVVAPNLVRIETDNPMVAVMASKTTVDFLHALLDHRGRESSRAGTGHGVSSIEEETNQELDVTR